MKPIYTLQGSGQYSFWLVNGNKDWATIPQGIIQDFDYPLNIRLQPGNNAWGQKHIDKKHSVWLKKHGKSVHNMLHNKLGQSGTIYTTETDNKLKITMSMAPGSLLILTLVEQPEDKFLTLVTMYGHTTRVDGTNIGRYISAYRN